MKEALIVLFLTLLSSASAATLTVWSQFSGSELTWLKMQADDFQQQTGNRVRVVSVPFGQIADRFIQNAPRGQGPDVVVALPQDWLGQLIAAGVIAPFNEFATARTNDGEIGKAFTYQGKLFGLPMTAEAVALVYNKKLLPTSPDTWADFLKAAQANTVNGRFGYLSDLSSPYMNYGVINAYGGYVFGGKGDTLDIKDIGLASAGADRAAAFLNDLRYKYNLVPAGMEDTKAKRAFLEGRVAMILTGPWDMDEIRASGINYGIAPFPTPPGASGKWSPFVTVQGVVLSAYGKQKTLAAQFAKQVTTSNAQVSFHRAGAGGRIPASVDARAQLRSDPVVSGFDRTISAGNLVPSVLEMGGVWETWNTAISQIMQKPSPNYMQILDAAVEEIKLKIEKSPGK